MADENLNSNREFTNMVLQFHGKNSARTVYMWARYVVIIWTDLVKYPHGQHGEGGVDNVVESDEVLIIHRLQEREDGYTNTGKMNIIITMSYSNPWL